MTVFLAIPAYRDPDVIPTIKSALHAPGAKVRIGVVWQGGPETAAQLADIPEVDMISMPAASARGTYWPRALLGTMLRDEDFILYVDSHMRFFDGWAADMVAQSAMVPERSILTTYPVKSGSDDSHATFMRYRKWDKWPRAVGNPIPVSSLSAPMKSRQASACFLWGPRAWALEVPWDPRHYYGFGEYAMLLRSWTRGWDVWHPCKTICTHDYGDRLRHWKDGHAGWVSQYWVGARRYEALLRGDDLGIYGLGTARTLADFEQYAGVDFEAETYVPDREWRR